MMCSVEPDNLSLNRKVPWLVKWEKNLYYA